jgi:predicted ATPase
MLLNLELENFKNFRRATVRFGRFTVLVGTNASGKSNLRDACRFLHGIARDYALAEVIGAKYGEGGELQWRGIRGGTKELAYTGESVFGLGLTMTVRAWEKLDYGPVVFNVRVHVGGNGANPPIILAESLGSGEGSWYDTHPHGLPVDADGNHVWAKIRRESTPGPRPAKAFLNNHSILSQITASGELDDLGAEIVSSVQRHLGSMRFLDLSPEKMRLPSFPGQVILGDQGENLSSVLQAICEEGPRKAALLEWVRELTPMDAVEFEFTPDQIGRVLLTLVETGGRRTSAYSASDGTLRFLAMAAALLGPDPARLYFIEELDNGIHPTRLHLLVQLIERTVRAGKTQVIATTHSPNLLGLLGEEALQSALLVYRLPHQPDARVKRIIELPDAERLIQQQNASRLHASGWLEDAVAFTEGGV